MNWPAIYPEILLLVMACVITLVDLWVRDPMRRLTFWLTQATLLAAGLMHLRAFDAGLTIYGMQAMVVADPMGHLLAFFAAVATLVSVARAALPGGARHAARRVLHADAVRSPRHLCDGRGEQLPDDLPRPRADEPVAVCADRAAPRPWRVHRGGDEVLRARRAGQRFPALRPVDDVRRHRLAGPGRGVQGHRHRPHQPGGAGLRHRLRRRRPGLQARRRAPSTCGCPTSTRGHRPR